MMKTVDLTREPWQLRLPGGETKMVMLPGTLDEFCVGHADKLDNSCHPDEKTAQSFDADVIATRFTRKYTYEGPAYFERTITIAPEKGRRTFLEIERARCVRVYLDGEEILPYEEQTISTPHVFELTGHEGRRSLCIVSDNSYPGLPHDAIVYSSAATDETQTNWNGLLGYIRLREENSVFLSQVRVYPEDGCLRVEADVDAAVGAGKVPEETDEAGQSLCFAGMLAIKSSALAQEYHQQISVCAGRTTIVMESLKLTDHAMQWDEYVPNLYELTATLQNADQKTDEKTARFGIRVFGDDGQGHLALNKRRIFLRSEANCAEFPETGYIPMEKDTWKKILKTYEDYGVNMVRFHSHCPPDAAFEAADEMGILMQPELSHWDPKHAFEWDESFLYYQAELRQIIKNLANHPSFVMLTFGNELHCGSLGTKRMHEMLAMAKAQDPTRLYANASNAHYGNEGCDEESDFFASQSYYSDRIRGTLAGNPETPEEAAAVEKYEKEHGRLAKVNIKGYINNRYPNAKTNFDETLAHIRSTYKKPVFSFEVGQFEVLPDFDELEHFHGISDPANYRRIQRMVRQKGLEPVWKQYVEATGELSRLCYREEIEAAMRTKELSGISLLGLQDFPGQGTALVGMLDSHLEPKPFDFAQPQAFSCFFRAQLPLVYLEKYTYEQKETLKAAVKLANYGKTDRSGEPKWTLFEVGDKKDGSDRKLIKKGSLAAVCCPAGTVSDAGMLEITLDDVKAPVCCELTVQIGEAVNSYPIWVYKNETPKRPECVYETQVLDAQAKRILLDGGIVYYSPKSEEESFHQSIRAQFSTDFWSVGTFGRQEGAMGQLIKKDHPVFRDFPTQSHTNWQWWPMANQRAVVLPKQAEDQLEVIITEMDSYAFLRSMAQLFECRVGNGRLLYSTLGLQDLQQYPEARALLSSIYRYLASEDFAPAKSMAWETLIEL